jgi:transposase
MDDKDAYISQLENTIKNLEQQVNNLTEIILLMRKQKFSSSSEKTPKVETGVQLDIFNEAEVETSPDVEEPAVRRVEGFYRKNPKTKREELLKDLPVQEIVCDIPEDQCFCPRCSSKLVPIGKETVREELQYIPAQLNIIRYLQLAYGCSECKKKGNPYIKKALTPTSLMNHSLASPSTVANVMYQKYVNSIPLYRQEKDWEQMGLALSRATMANWIIRCSQDWLAPVADFLKKELLKRNIIHCDETPVQVLKEQGKAPQTKYSRRKLVPGMSIAFARRNSTFDPRRTTAAPGDFGPPPSESCSSMPAAKRRTSDTKSRTTTRSLPGDNLKPRPSCCTKMRRLWVTL